MSPPQLVAPQDRPLPESEFPYVDAYLTTKGVRWRFQFRDSRGKPSTRRGFLTDADAQRAREKLMGVKHVKGIVANKLLFRDFVELWLAARKPYLELRTWEGYEINARLRLTPEFGDRRLVAIETQHIADWLVETAEAGEFAPKTLNNTLATLSSALSYAAREGYVPANAASPVEPLPSEHLERDWLRLHEIPRYLAGCAEVYRPLAHLLIATGMRISEAIALRWKDIDWDNRIVRVYRQRKRGGDGKTKGRRSRKVVVGPEFLAAMSVHFRRQCEMLDGDIADRYVFVMPIRQRKDERGHWASKPAYQQFDRNTVSRDWHKAALKAAGLRDMPLHALRHTAAASWLVSNQPLVFVQRQLGHSHINTTERIYGHLEQSFLIGAPEETEAAIRAARPPRPPAPGPARGASPPPSGSTWTSTGRVRLTRAA